MIADGLVERGRYQLLETVRGYAAERLVEAGEDGQTRVQQREYYLALAEDGSIGRFD